MLAAQQVRLDHSATPRMGGQRSAVMGSGPEAGAEYTNPQRGTNVPACYPGRIDTHPAPCISISARPTMRPWRRSR